MLIYFIDFSIIIITFFNMGIQIILATLYSFLSY